MHTFLNFFLCLIITLCIITMLITQTSSEKTTKTCDLQFTSGSENNVVQENEKGDLYINFELSDNCVGSQERILVKLATRETGRPIDFCTIVFHNNACKSTDLSKGCYCFKKGSYYRVSWNSKHSDESLMLKVTNLSTREEKIIFLNKTVLPAYRTKDTPIQILGPSEIIGICSGIIVAVVVAAILIRKWSSGGSCARQLQGPAKEDCEVTLSNVAVTQTKQNTGSSSGLQEQEDIQTRPGSLAPPENHEVVDNEAISVSNTISKRKTEVYSHIILTSDNVNRSEGEVYNHINPLTNTTPGSQAEEVCSSIVTSSDTIISSEAPKCNPAIPSINTSSSSQKPPDDTSTTNYAQVRRHTITSTKKEKRFSEQVYDHAVPYTNSDSKRRAQVKFTIVPSKMFSPIKPAKVCSNTLPSSCTGARCPTQVYNHNLSFSYLSHRSQAHKCNQTIQYSVVRREEPKDGQVMSLSQRDVDSQEPVQIEFQDHTVFPPNRRRQVAHTMYDHINY